jgi:hypothetical protein
VNSRKVISGLCGGAVVAICIWLERQGKELESQIVLLTVLALVAPVGMAIVNRGPRKMWFYVAVTCCSALHVLLLWSIRRSTAFSSLGAAILVGFIECLVLMFVTAKIIDAYE